MRSALPRCARSINRIGDRPASTVRQRHIPGDILIALGKKSTVSDSFASTGQLLVDQRCIMPVFNIITRRCKVSELNCRLSVRVSARVNFEEHYLFFFNGAPQPSPRRSTSSSELLLGHI